MIKFLKLHLYEMYMYEMYIHQRKERHTKGEKRVAWEGKRLLLLFDRHGSDERYDLALATAFLFFCLSRLVAINCTTPTPRSFSIESPLAHRPPFLFLLLLIKFAISGACLKKPAFSHSALETIASPSTLLTTILPLPWQLPSHNFLLASRAFSL